MKRLLLIVLCLVGPASAVIAQTPGGHGVWLSRSWQFGGDTTLTSLTVTSTAADAIDVAGGLTAGSGNVAIIDTTGKIPALSGTYLASLSGANLTTLNASNISSGTLANARLPTNVDLGGTLDVTGATTLDGTFGVVGAVTFNDAGADVDFRVESDDNENMLFVDGGEDRVGIGTGSPQQTLHVDRANGPHLLLARTNTGISFTDGTTLGHIEIGGEDADSTYDGDAAQIIGQAAGAWTSSSHPTEMLFTTTAASSTTAAERMRINEAGYVGIGTDAPSQLLTLIGADDSDVSVQLGTTSDTTGAQFAWDYDNGSVGKLVFGTQKANALVSIRSGGNGEAIAIDASQKVGIGTADMDGLVHIQSASAGAVSAHANADELVVENSAHSGITILAGATSTANVFFGDAGNSSEGAIYYINDGTTSSLNFQNEFGYINLLPSGGDAAAVGIGVSDPDVMLEVMMGASSEEILKLSRSATQYLELGVDAQATNNKGHLWFNGVSTMAFYAGGVAIGEAFAELGGANRIPADGAIIEGVLGVGTSVPEGNFHVDAGGSSDTAMTLGHPYTSGGATINIISRNDGDLEYHVYGTNGDVEWNLESGNTFSIDESFSVAGTKSFRITHPLDDTKLLTHSSIEGPRYDLLYRDVVTLVDGTATVSIDVSQGMTPGTWEALCRGDEAQVFVMNETGWGAVRGSVDPDGTLTITAQDVTSTATVSWLVVAERNDPQIYTANTSDDNGRMVLESEKPDEPEHVPFSAPEPEEVDDDPDTE